MSRSPIIDSTRIRTELERLVAIPSVTGDEAAIQDYLASRLAAIGMEVARFESDPAELATDPAWPGSEVPRKTLSVVAGTLSGRRPGPRRLLIGHVDVVPAGDLRTWNKDPFSPTVLDGHLYGRGACDMKGGVTAILEAVTVVAEGDRDFAGEVVVVLVPSEEDGGGGALAAIRSGLTGDMAVVTEPTRLEVVIAHAGAITFTLDVPGRAAHASTRTEGVSALDKLQLLAQALAADEEARNSAETDPLMTGIGLPYPTIIGKVAGGEWASTVLDRLVVEGRYGVKLGQTTEEAAEGLASALGAVWGADDFLRDFPLRLRITGGRFGSSRVAEDHPLPHSLAEAAAVVTGRRPPLVGVPYGADMRLFVDEGRTPCVMYGPGDVRHAHAANEKVALAEVEICAQVLYQWVTSPGG